MKECTCLAQRLDAIDRQVLEIANNYGRALALLEDRIKHLEARASDHEERLHKVEEQELNEVDERLCRLESPPVWEIDHRATAKPSKEGAAPTRVFECRDCSNPCELHVDGAAVVPTLCPYCNNEVNWQERRPAAKKPKICAIIIGS